MAHFSDIPTPYEIRQATQTCSGTFNRQLHMHPYLDKVWKSDVSTRSKETHLERCRMLAKACDRPLDEILKNPQDSYNKIKQHYGNINSQNSILGTVLSILKHNRDEPMFREDSAILIEWRDLKSKVREVIDEISMDCKLSDKEKKGWVEWNMVLERQQELTRDEYGSDRHLILSLYCLIPPKRLDYNNVKIYSQVPSEEQTGNYLIVYGPEKMSLFLRVYKTVGMYGPQQIDLPVNLCQIVYHSLQNVPRSYLICLRRDPSKPMENKSTYQKFVSATLKSIFDKPVTVNILRHSYTTHLDYNKMTPRDMINTAKQMDHSLAQQNYYRRFPDYNTQLAASHTPTRLQSPQTGSADELSVTPHFIQEAVVSGQPEQPSYLETPFQSNLPNYYSDEDSTVSEQVLI